MEVRSRRGRESSSPDRAKGCMQPRVKPTRKVQVVYYLTRNGQLEHPHYMEVTHSANQPLRLKDVMERLTVLRGKGMPSLYSWSCKRTYKNGYVWNDLVDNDIIYPSEGAEYVLKGSELVEGCSERFQQTHGSNRAPPIHQEPNIQYSKQKSPSFRLITRSGGGQEVVERRTTYEDQEFDEVEEEEEEEAFELDEEKTSYTSSTTPHSRCSRGVSTDELEDQETTHQENQKNLNGSNSGPSILSEKPNQGKNSTSKRFEDGDPVTTGSGSSRNSVLLHLIACGNLAVAKAKNGATLKQSALNTMAKKSTENLHRGVLCKSAAKVAEEDIISCMSENPRFGNLQAEEKEYFSGSIVESIKDRDRAVAEPVLKKSNSYNEERSSKAGLGEMVVEDKEDAKATKGNCIPRKKSSSALKKTRK